MSLTNVLKETISRQHRSYSNPNISVSTYGLEHSFRSRQSSECVESLCDSANESTEVILNIVELTPSNNFSTSAVLHYCKKKILVPYHRFLSMLGWRPIMSSTYNTNCWSRFAAILYTLLVMTFAFVGYVLQYAACFRRDIVDGYMLFANPMGDYSNSNSTDDAAVCKGTAMGLYFVPSILHFSAYCYTLYMLRVCENEQLQILMERVFLQAFYLRSNFITQPKLLTTLRIFLGLTLCWIMISAVIQSLHVVVEYPTFTWLEGRDHLEVLLIVTLVISVTFNDVIHVTIIVSYGIQCQLLSSFARGICERVKEKSITLQDSVKEIAEVFKTMKYLNEEFAVPVSLMIMQSAVYSLSGFHWALTTHNMSTRSSLLLATNFSSMFLWVSIFAFPLVQATRLSASGHCLKKLGIYLQTRPFGYQQIPQTELDSFLLYTMSTNIEAKIFRVPIKPAAIFGFVALSGFSLLLLAQLQVIKLGI